MIALSVFIFWANLYAIYCNYKQLYELLKKKNLKAPCALWFQSSKKLFGRIHEKGDHLIGHLMTGLSWDICWNFKSINSIYPSIAYIQQFQAEFTLSIEVDLYFISFRSLWFIGCKHPVMMDCASKAQSVFCFWKSPACQPIQVVIIPLWFLSVQNTFFVPNSSSILVCIIILGSLAPHMCWTIFILRCGQSLKSVMSAGLLSRKYSYNLNTEQALFFKTCHYFY